MSLTERLRDTHDPVRLFFSEQLPHTRRALAALPATDRAALRSVVVAPTTGGPSYPWATVGMAFDYLVRFLIRPTPTKELFARRGAAILARRHSRTVPDAWPHLTELLASLGDKPAPADLARPCYALALYEQLCRRPSRPHWPLPALGPAASLDQVLDICPVEAATDLVRLAELTYRAAPRLLADHAAVLNPTFVGSVAVGGGDADLITDHVLIELKVVGRPRLAEDLRQLVGYLLLDWDDRHRITQVGVYYARQGVLLTWPVGDLLEVLAGQRTDLADLRGRFREVCEQARTSPPGLTRALLEAAAAGPDALKAAAAALIPRGRR